MCNVALTPVKKINIISNVIISSAKYDEEKVDSPASITYKKDTEIVELTHECDMIPEPGLSKYCEALLNDKENYSPFDDSDADQTYSPSVFIKTHTDFQMMFIKLQKFLSSFCCSKMKI
ncbi:uncharacterized protein [Leptinotarsa decemlineata]|uniref:uncharacterized protein n=1 Tax=Leptinotarsa decemlineata TaxID=7539 RepID=UPI003D3058F6